MAKGPSDEIDERIVIALIRIETAALAAAGLVSLAALLWWTVSAATGGAPPPMSANSATGMLLALVSLLLSPSHPHPLRAILSHTIAALLLALAVLVLWEYLAGASWRFESLLPHANGGFHAGRIPLQSAVAFTLVAGSIVLLRHTDDSWSVVGDMLAMALIALLLVLLGGRIYGSLELAAGGPSALTSPPALFCFCCLTFAIASQRARQGGLLTVLITLGIGSQVVRATLPLVVALPFLVFAAVHGLISSNWLSPPFATAAGAAAEAFVTLCIVVWVAWRANALERALRELSLTDELTQVNNRRGFYLLGRQVLREAVRSKSGLTVFFFDVDELKRINDTAGHDAGSHIIKALARSLIETFRDSDVIGRLGGDEFSVVAAGSDIATAEILVRLEERVAAFNQQQDDHTRLRFSVGYAEAKPGATADLDDLVAQADAMMYREKAARRSARPRPAGGG
jgi:diguanylate cyclase (GGDEF)-like protein